MPADRPGIWQPFVRAAIAIGLVAGFSVGFLLFISLLFDFASGLWWPAIAETHGHAQLFGWAGLMVLGIGIHFLPRLASTPNVGPDVARVGFWILLTGLSTRLVTRPMMTISGQDGMGQAIEYAWTIGAAGELVGVVVLVVGLGRSLAAGRSQSIAPAAHSLLPLLVTSFTSLLAVLAITTTLGLYRLPDGSFPVDRTTSDSLILLTIYGFLVPVSIAMSARLFPLYVRTNNPRLRAVQGGLVLLLIGVTARLAGHHWSISPLDLPGRALILAGILGFVMGLRIFETRRALPRRPIRLWRDPTGLHALSAYMWLIVAAFAQILGEPWQDLEIHLLGVGFVSLLIFGMGVHLIPGFARSSMRHSHYVWGTLVLGNLATILRGVPSAPAISLPGSMDHIAGAAAGIAGLLALILFTVNISSALRMRFRPDGPAV